MLGKKYAAGAGMRICSIRTTSFAKSRRWVYQYTPGDKIRKISMYVKRVRLL